MRCMVPPPYCCSAECPVLCRQIKQSQDDEKKQLMDLRDLIKSATQLDQREVRLPHSTCGFRGQGMEGVVTMKVKTLVANL